MMIRTVLIASTLVLYSCGSIADREPLNCTLAYTDPALSQCSRVRYASEFSDCISSSDISEHTCLILDSDARFCSNQTSVPITAFFTESNRTLDCSDGTIDHGWGRVSLPSGPATTQGSFKPGVRLLDDESLENLSVKNCTIRGTNHMGIKASRFFGGELGGNGKLDADEPLPVGHRQLNFENLIIEDTITGIFLGNFSEDVTINQVHIDNSSRIAIYSEAGSHRIRIKDSIISNNQTREAVAIDSTYDSEITGSLFVNNREGAINVYQNCGELKGIVCPIIRSTPPNNNQITDNIFVGNGVSGVQIASRQGRNHSLGWCATLNGLPGKFVDTAQDNTVSNNTFVCDQGTSLIIKDGPNQVSNNRVIARHDCVPFEISTGGLSRSYSDVLNGLQFNNNSIDSSLPPRLRNINSEIEYSGNQ